MHVRVLSAQISLKNFFFAKDPMTEFPVKKFPVVVSYVYANISVCCLPGYLKLAICVSE